VCVNNDADGDGSPNFLDLDSDEDSLSDEQEGIVDSDDDGIPDWLDPDGYQEQEIYYCYIPLHFGRMMINWGPSAFTD
jgi:hypothetical protein